MRILITNDDGIDAIGIKALARWAQKLGEVTVVAPKKQQSGMSHSINITDAVEIKGSPPRATILAHTPFIMLTPPPPTACALDYPHLSRRRVALILSSPA